VSNQQNGNRLPSMAWLAGQFQVSRVTLQKWRTMGAPVDSGDLEALERWYRTNIQPTRQNSHRRPDEEAMSKITRAARALYVQIRTCRDDADALLPRLQLEQHRFIDDAVEEVVIGLAQEMAHVHLAGDEAAQERAAKVAFDLVLAAKLKQPDRLPKQDATDDDAQ
jgi:hypothetical protein